MIARTVIAERFAGDWPLPTALVREECDAYIVEARTPGIDALPTRCEPWTVEDLSKHLAATFHRFVELLRRTRAGETRPPFEPRALSEENLQAVREFPADPIAELCAEVDRFCSLATDPAEPILNQHGLIPVGLQMAWGLNELAVHHDDLAHARGRAYRPREEVVTAIVPAYRPLTGRAPRSGADAWEWCLRASAR